MRKAYLREYADESRIVCRENGEIAAEYGDVEQVLKPIIIMISLFLRFSQWCTVIILRTSKRNLICVLICISIAAVIFFLADDNHIRIQNGAWLSRTYNNKTYIVELDENGFEPSRVLIQIGDTVTFRSRNQKSFWPASDLHPAHTLYPAFDPQKPIYPPHSWTFIFMKEGIWEYHDHLAPGYKGIVEVKGGKSGNMVPCNAEMARSPSCWKNQIKIALEEHSVSGAFDVVAALYDDPLFQSDCHSYAHLIGEATYHIYAARKPIHFSPKTSYCGYGFYHGFMETLLHSTGDINKATNFCVQMQAELGNEASDAKGACYHGIGHGAVDGADRQSWGDAHKIMAPAMKLCKAVADEHDIRIGSLFYRCITGIYNALEILSADSRYGLSSLRADPFSFCMKEPNGYQEPCATNMVPILLSGNNLDFYAMTKQIKNIKEPNNVFSIRTVVISSLFYEFTRYALVGTKVMDDGIRLCHSLSPQLRLACIEGLAGGHMQYGEPTKQYVKGLAFCNSPLFASDEQTSCFKYILTRLPIWYTPSVTDRICNSVEKHYQNFCLHES